LCRGHNFLMKSKKRLSIFKLYEAILISECSSKIMDE